jgi:hypothetical protein
MNYIISGDTFSIKEDLKSCGCHWDPKKKAWITPFLEKDGPLYAKINTICRYSDVKIVLEQMSAECKKIQDILNRSL